MSSLTCPRCGRSFLPREAGQLYCGATCRFRSQSSIVPFDSMRHPLIRFVSAAAPVEPVGGPPGNADDEPEDDMYVCGRCFRVNGTQFDRRRLCGRATVEERDARRAAAFRQDGSHWTTLVELCRCCGAEAIDASHKFAHWFCDECLQRAAKVNRTFGGCVIPVGWHSVVSGVFARRGPRAQDAALGALADQLSAFLRGSDGVWPGFRST